MVKVKPVARLRATLQYCHAMLVFLLRASCDSNFNSLSKRLFILEYCELTVMASNITSVSKREEVNFPLVVRLSKSRNMLKASSFISNRLQCSFKVPTKWDGGSGKTKMERTHSRYSKCGICGVLEGFQTKHTIFWNTAGLTCHYHMYPS